MQHPLAGDVFALAAGDMRSFAVSCVLVYSIPDFTETGKIYYAVGAYIFMTLMYTAINIPYCSLGGGV